MSDSKSKEIDFESLRFIRVFTPMHIPKYLIEQVKDRTYDVEDWYKYQEMICLHQTDEGPKLNPLSLLYVIADEDNQVVGMLWCEIEAMSKVLILQTFSMDKKYWMKGKAVEVLADKVKEIVRECKLKKVYWNNAYPKHAERYGFKRSRTVLMEWNAEEEASYEESSNKDEEKSNDKVACLS